ncbi:DPP IV N-terminal domain-containing protein [Sphingobacterium sp. DN00404]|uniref:DPP IV N-terminal domain-containing protein n=1 Tax=Sphingobacterium micropteri TaxID=2763501 RepID=A0ABR7YJ12_9SPHI|nr:DPP IV N-terminal domain-containing protein [Sphingobacterium micropteri]MBD1431312.1 DPP IV N-terminal domain-containing protein [Sphingobacterium micropteri]
MHKVIINSLVVVGLLFTAPVCAQKKALNFAQSWGQEISVTKPINQYTGWADNDHYIERDRKDGRLYQIHVTTGKRTPYTPPVKSDTEVFVKNNDVYIRYGNSPDRRLTHSPDVEEKNPTLSPDGEYVAFTRNNDLYSVKIDDGNEVRYTSDGTDVIYNGWSSWVYYEEILGRATNYKAFWWSPDSKQLAFMRFDDTQVPMFPIYVSEGQHGYLEETRYPKAGDPNPEVKIGFVKVEGSPIIWADFNEQDDQYFGEPYWSFDSQSIMVQWMNRDQTNLKFYSVNPINGTKNEIYDEQQPTWINLDHSERITYMADNKHYILKSDRTGWAHYYLYTLDGKLVNPLTSGDWQVTSLALIDERHKVVYFTARKENSATVDLYRVDYSGRGLKRLTFGNYTHQVKVSPDGRYFITDYSNVSTPNKIALLDNKGKLVKELADSKSIDFDQYNVGKTEYFTIPSDDGKFDLPVIITYPVDFDETKTYPVVMSIYGGPDAGTVKNTWKGTSSQYWAKEGIIQITCDHRASGHFGKQGVAWMHRNLGKWEMIDYITIAKWLKAKPWVADDKLLITGHSYGGYMTCLALTKGAAYFDYGIAGAPVTSWELYDTHYTERWMDTPQDNPQGYHDGSVLTYVNQYKGRLRIMHGDIDDNVHMQNTMQLVDALTDGEVPFEFMIYPGSRHGFARSKTAYDFKERVRFYYQYLLEKAVPEDFK